MARNQITITIDEPGRDAGKSFILCEMPADQAERWAGRALLVAAQSGADINNVRAGMAGVATMGISAVFGAKWAEMEPLLDEMFECVAYLPNPANPLIARGGKYCRGGSLGQIVGRLTPDDIEEVKTRVRLRAEILTLHLGFSPADALSQWMAASAQPTSQTTPTSPPSSEPSSQPD